MNPVQSGQASGCLGFLVDKCSRVVNGECGYMRQQTRKGANRREGSSERPQEWEGNGNEQCRVQNEERETSAKCAK